MTCEIDDVSSIGDEDHGGCSQTRISPLLAPNTSVARKFCQFLQQDARLGAPRRHHCRVERFWCALGPRNFNADGYGYLYARSVLDRTGLQSSSPL